jgi:hypothetical protein
MARSYKKLPITRRNRFMTTILTLSEFNMDKNRFSGITLMTAAVVSVLIASYLRGNFYTWGIYSIVILAGSIVSFLAFIMLKTLCKIKNSQKLIKASRHAALIFSVILILSGSVLLAKILDEYDTDQAKKFCDSIQVKLEQYKKENGVYPASLKGLITDSIEIPPRIRDHDFFQSNGREYIIIVPLNGPNDSGYVYESKNGKWEQNSFIHELKI